MRQWSQKHVGLRVILADWPKRKRQSTKAKDSTNENRQWLREHAGQEVRIIKLDGPEGMNAVAIARARDGTQGRILPFHVEYAVISDQEGPLEPKGVAK